MSPETRPSLLQWPAIFAGAIAAAGVSFTLHAFASGIGLSAISPAPGWRESSVWLVLLAGMYFLFVSLTAFGFGGYVAGRMRTRLDVTSKEAEFRDGMHGLITWALAIVLTAVLALGAAATARPVLAAMQSSQNNAQASAGEILFVSELDELFRSENGFPDPYRRAEAARILLKAGSNDGVPIADRDFLSNIVARVSGLPQEDATSRVFYSIDRAAEAIRKARVMTVLQAFFIGAALFVGAAVAWFATVEGGREREAGAFPKWNWSLKRREYTAL